MFFIDPYLSDFAEQWTYGWDNEHVRMSAILIQPKELYGIDYVICTHDHADHIDPFTIPIIALRNPDTRFIAPRVARTRMLGLFVEEAKLHLMSGTDSIELPHLSVHALPAAHATLKHDEENGYHFLSYIIQVDDITILHLGDTVSYEGQINYYNEYSIDLAFVPINGREAERFECEPNFDIDEAIEFAQATKARMVIPMHYDMYTLNTANVSKFALKAQGKFDHKIAQLGIPFIHTFS